MSDDFDKLKAEDDFDRLEGEPGHAGHDPYAKGETEKRRAQMNTRRKGDLKDAAISWADTVAVGGGPQIAGAMGALANAVTDPLAIRGTDVDAYRDVRDHTKKRIDTAEDTTMGGIGSALGMMSTPWLPAVARGATIPERAWQAGKVGGAVGGLHAAFTSPEDLTRADIDSLKRFLKTTASGTGAGALGAAATGALFAAGAGPARAVAETEALRAAGLEAGIKNSIQKDLGVASMPEARKIGRQFLDEGLIPVVGSSEAVAKRAGRMQNKAGAGIDSALGRVERGGTLDASENANAVRKMLFGESAVADELSGAKARALADALEKQGERTPGSFVGQNRAKSDAWKSADFSADPKMAATLYRKGVGAARTNIEEQAARIDPQAAADLAKANEKWGIGADALKLAENASTRAGARKGLNPVDLLALAAGGGAGVAGRPVEGAGVAIATMLGKRAFDGYGHSSTARFADFLANRSGGGIGGQAGAEAWSRFLKNPEDEGKE